MSSTIRENSYRLSSTSRCLLLWCLARTSVRHRSRIHPPLTLLMETILSKGRYVSISRPTMFDPHLQIPSFAMNTISGGRKRYSDRKYRNWLSPSSDLNALCPAFRPFNVCSSFFSLRSRFNYPRDLMCQILTFRKRWQVKSTIRERVVWCLRDIINRNGKELAEW